jgi:glycosyltransferase involved in cell wall biosynthesis
MKASVIIPVFNGEAYVGNAIASALSQTERDIEVIVVDDGSTDATGDVVRAFSDPRLQLIKQRNAGPSAARNRGITASSGEWVGFLDADDSWRPEKVAAHLKRADEVPEAGLTYSSVVVRDRDGALVQILQADVEGWMLERLLFGNIIWGGGSSTLVRRDVFERVGCFDPEIKYGEDWEMWLRAASAFQFAAVAEPLTCRLQRPDSYGTDVAAMRDDCVTFLNAAFDTYASAHQSQRAKAIAEVYYRSAVELHDEQERRRSAVVDLVRTLRRNPFHPYAYRRLIRLAMSSTSLLSTGPVA